MSLLLVGCNENNNSESSDSSDSSISETTENPSSTDESEPGSESSETEEPEVLSEADFQDAISFSKPTKIITNQTFLLEDSDILLHYSSSLTIEYSSTVKTCYSYSYEKLNTLTDGSEEFVSLVNGTLYSSGAYVYDGVNWIYSAEKIVTFSHVVLNKEYSDFSIEDNVLNGTVKEGKEKAFFGGVDYGVNNVSYQLSLAKKNLSKLNLSFDTFVECVNEFAHVDSVTVFTYNQESVNIPE